MGLPAHGDLGKRLGSGMTTVHAGSGASATTSGVFGPAMLPASLQKRGVMRR